MDRDIAIERVDPDWREFFKNLNYDKVKALTTPVYNEKKREQKE